MTGRPRSNRSMIYHSLREDCDFTHHQARVLIRTYLDHMGSWNWILTTGLKKEKEIWIESAEIVAGLSMREDPRLAGRSIVQHCWPDRISSLDPEAPFVCATEAAKIVRDGMRFDDQQRRTLWNQIQCILDHEERSAITAWDERLIHKYLQIRGFLPP